MIRIAAYQGPCSDDVAANCARVAEVIRKAGERGADFLCFPEGYLSNYRADLALRSDDSKLRDLVREADRQGVVLLVGFSEEAQEGVYNSVLVAHGGRVLGIYRKVMLTGEDRRNFAPGRRVPVFDAKGVRFGVIVCHDSSFIEPALATRCKGARLLFSPHYNRIAADQMDEHRVLVNNNHVGLASLLQMVVVRANVVGWDGEKLGYGDSAIFSPLGVAVARAPLFSEALIEAEFDERTFAEERWRSRAEVPSWLRRELCRALLQGEGTNDADLPARA